MGWKYEVEAYYKVSPGVYEWTTIYEGQWRVVAKHQMRKAKRNVGAVRLTWRG